jgi:hypothetical protein
MLCRVLEILNVTHQPQQFSNSKFKTVINCSSDPDALGFGAETGAFGSLTVKEQKICLHTLIWPVIVPGPKRL